MKIANGISKKSRVLSLLLMVICVTWSLFVGVVTAGEIRGCLEDEYGGDTNCTANDVRVVLYFSPEPNIICTEGQPVTTELDAQLVAGANERYDIGLFVALDGGDALTGSCYWDYLEPVTDSMTPAGEERHSPFYDAEGDGDMCGDLEQGVVNIRYLGEQSFVCQDFNGDGFADIRACASWDNQENKIPCTSLEQTLPNTKSKCRCEYSPTNIPIGGTIRVIKQTVPSGNPADFNFELSGGPAGNTTSDSFTLGHGDPAYEKSNLWPGSYQVTETVPGGWELTDLTCTVSDLNGGSYLKDMSLATATVDLKAGETWTCTYTDTLIAEDLTVTKTATPAFNRTYDWTITKEADATYNLFAGASQVHGYTVTVDQTTTDSAWQVTGTITVSNPNTWTAVTLSSIEDAVNNGGVCTVAPGPYTVPASGTLDVGYTCTYASAPSPAAGINTVTITWDKSTYFTPNDTASDPESFDFSGVSPTQFGYSSINVTDTNGQAWSTSADASWSYDKTFTCSSDPAAYTDGTYSDTHVNTATITETSQSDNATVNVNCYAPVITKSASATWSRDVDWTISKDVTPASATRFIGESATYDYTVNLTKSASDTYTVSGTIFVTNPAGSPGNMTVSLADLLGDGSNATVNCSVGSSVTVMPGVQTYCTYTGDLAAKADGTNTATGTFNGIQFVATAPYAFGAPSYVAGAEPETINVSDTLKGSLGSFSDSGLVNYSLDQACSNNPSDYAGDGFWTADYPNTASIVETTGDNDSESVQLNCYAPLVSKTAAGTFDERHEWEVDKSVDKESQNAFAGDTVSYEWTVVVTEQTVTENYNVAGTITVQNPAPIQMIVDLSDILGGGTVASIGPCVNGTYSAGTLTIAASTTATCPYSATPANSSDTVNNVSATLNGIPFTASDPIEWSSSVIRGSASLDDDQNPTFPLEITDGGTWTYTENYTCSTTRSDYGVTSFTYLFGENNTAIVSSGGSEQDRDDAATEVNCYWPQIDLDKSGDELSKITDKVYYDITLYNNTPTSPTLRALECTISDPTIGFSKTVQVASGASDSNLDIEFTISSGAADPFPNTASVTCSPLGSSFSVSDSDTWNTNLFQPAVEIVKTGPDMADPGETITYNFTINNISSGDAPALALDTISDDVLGNLASYASVAGCNTLAPGGSCTFNVDYTLPAVITPLPADFKNIVTVHYHPTGFPNDITDTDDHTVLVMPESQLTDTSYCPLPDDQFRMLYRLEETPNIYRHQANNPGQFYYNAFYTGEAGDDFTMTIEIPYPFVTQEGAGVPIQVHDGTGLTSERCYIPNPRLDGYSITTTAMMPTSNAGNQIVSPEDYATKQLGQQTIVTVSGKIPETGLVYVTIHLDDGFKKTGGWEMTGNETLNPVTDEWVKDVTNQAGFGNGPVTVHGYEQYNFSRTVGSDTASSTPSSYNEFKKIPGFLGFVTNALTGAPVVNAKIEIYDPNNELLTTQATDTDGFYQYQYKHSAGAANYTVKAPAYNKSTIVELKANGFAPVDFEIIDPLDGDRGFVRQVYLDFLNREPDEAGLNYWIGQLSSGTMTRAAVVEQYLLSPEFGEKVAPVARLYFAYFNRLPDYDGLMYWVNELTNSGNLARISDAFASSPEFQSTYGNLSNSEFVTLVYQNVLGRDPESDGLAFWTNELNTENRTRGQAMTGFSESLEYRNLMANKIYVAMTYIGLLRRAPEPDGFNYWVNRMDQGDSGQVLIGLFLQSTEYFARFKK